MGNLDALNIAKRDFVYSDMALSSLKKTYKYVEEGTKILMVSREEVANFSDLFILYPVSLFITADKESIIRFLSGERRRNPAAHIADLDDSFSREQDFLENRLSAMYKCGMVFKINYRSRAGHEVALYSTPKDTVDLISKRLDRRLLPEKWNGEVPFYRLIGRASAGLVAATVSRHKNYRGLSDCVAEFKKSHTTILPEFRMVNSRGEEYIVGFYYSFLHHDDRIHSFDQYVRYVVMPKVYLCEEYATYRTKKGNSYIVISVEDMEDLYTFAKALLSSSYLNDEKLTRIYFCGEGIIKSAKDLESMQGMFLRLLPNGSFLEDETPPFLE